MADGQQRGTAATHPGNYLGTYPGISDRARLAAALLPGVPCIVPCVGASDPENDQSVSSVSEQRQ